MKHLDMNTVISWGLVIMGVLSVGGWIVISIQTGTSSGTEVPIAIISGLTGVLTGKNIAQRQGLIAPPPDDQQQILRYANDKLQKASDMADTALDLLQSKKQTKREEGAPNGESEHQGN